MKNYKQPGVNITVTVDYDVKSGDPVMVGAALFGVASLTSAANTANAIVTQGVFDLPKPAGQPIAPGAKLYWDAATKGLTTTAGGNPYVAVAETGAMSAAVKVSARLNGVVI